MERDNIRLYEATATVPGYRGVPFYMRVQQSKAYRRNLQLFTLPEQILHTNQKYTVPRSIPRETGTGTPGKRAAFFIRTKRKGSLTVEAAITVPVFLLAVIVLLQMIDLYRIHGLLTLSLQECAKELSVYGSGIGGDGNTVPETAVCVAYARAKLPSEVADHGTISLAGSTIKDDILELRAVYIPKLGNSLLPVRMIMLTARASVHLFNGYGGNGKGSTAGSCDEGDMVYVTEHESVYHTDASCSYIALKIHETTREQAVCARNQYGGRYDSCEKCIGQGVVHETVYLTEQGTKYHNSLKCSGLKRTVRLVEKDTVYGMALCSRCEKRHTP